MVLLSACSHMSLLLINTLRSYSRPVLVPMLHSWTDSAINFHQLSSSRLKLEHISLDSRYVFSQRPDPMDKQSPVVFRNVGQLYFPQSRVECHYSLTSDHQWSSSDWIGIFEVYSQHFGTTPPPSRPYLTLYKSICVACGLKCVFCCATGGLVLIETVLHIHMGPCSWGIHRGNRCKLLCTFPRWEFSQTWKMLIMSSTGLKVRLAVPRLTVGCVVRVPVLLILRKTE